MKIEGTCRRCGRDFLVGQVIRSGGDCPWDGKPFEPDYAVVLVDALRDAEAAGTALEDALGKVADLEPDFVLHADSILETLRAHIERLERLHAHGASGR